MKTPIRIGLADDHRLLREGLLSLLQKIKEVVVIGEMSTGEEAVNFATQHKPDLMLLDIVMTGMTGIEATRWIKEQSPEIKIILISSQVNKEFIMDGIKCGIDGYLDKNIDKTTLHAAITKVMNGEQYFSPEITALVFQDFYLKQKDGKGLPAKKNSTLSKREEQVLTLIAHGKKLREIADELFISVKTVETHKLHIQDKLNLFTTAHLVKYAIENKLLILEK